MNCERALSTHFPSFVFPHTVHSHSTPVWIFRVSQQLLARTLRVMGSSMNAGGLGLVCSQTLVPSALRTVPSTFASAIQCDAAAPRHRRLSCGSSGREARARRRRQCGGVVFASIRDAQELVQSGIIRSVSSRDIPALLSEGGYKLLDIRPTWEHQKAYVAGSYHVPLFIEDLDTGAITLLKKGILAGQGGWWMGLRLTTRNEEFVEQVQAAVPKGQKLVVACGEGLRSLLALEELHDAGFESLVWIAGGFNAVRDEDFQVEGSTKLRFATVGGASEYVLKFAMFIQGLINSVKGSQSVDGS